MTTRNALIILTVAMLVATVALAPAAQAAPGDPVVFNSSTQLNLTGYSVLAAVNFYDPDRAQHYTVGAIQGVEFDDFDIDDEVQGGDDGTLFNVAGGTLSTVIAQRVGREFSGAAGSGDPWETQIGSFTPPSPPTIPKQKDSQMEGRFGKMEKPTT